MHGIGTNGEGRSRKQLANPGSPWKWPLKWCVRWRNWQLYFCIALWTWVCGSMWLYLCYSVLYTSSGLLTCIWWYVLLIGKENGAYSGLRKSKRTGSNKSVASEYVLLYNVIIIIVVKKIIFSNVVQLKGLTMLNSSEYRWQLLLRGQKSLLKERLYSSVAGRQTVVLKRWRLAADSSMHAQWWHQWHNHQW